MDKEQVRVFMVGDEVLIKTSLWDELVPPNQIMRQGVCKAYITKVLSHSGKVYGYDLKCDEYEKGFTLPIDYFEEFVELYKTGLKTKDKLRGHAFKGIILKNTTGNKNQELIDQFQGKEFLLDSFSGKYVYGFPVGHFGDLNFRFQFELSSVRFYSEDQDTQDSSPYIPLQNYICHVADNW